MGNLYEKMQADLTREQRLALERKWHDSDNGGMTLDAFMSSVQHTIMLDGAVTVQWCGMWLCVERDGYCHT